MYPLFQTHLLPQSLPQWRLVKYYFTNICGYRWWFSRRIIGGKKSPQANFSHIPYLQSELKTRNCKPNNVCPLEEILFF